MADKGLWDRVREELNSPWDWIAAGAGATGGLIVSASIFHTDLGTSIGVGALGAVTARKSATAALRGRVLQRRTDNLITVIKSSTTSLIYDFDALVANIERDRALWRGKIIDDSQYEILLDKYIERYRVLTAQ